MEQLLTFLYLASATCIVCWFDDSAQKGIHYFNLGNQLQSACTW